tara:strand:+ start:164573 stop:164677 length:105 start_codon:yes stop_codon:yes gene_type:complete
MERKQEENAFKKSVFLLEIERFQHEIVHYAAIIA